MLGQQPHYFMNGPEKYVLTINAGSSSIKFAVYRTAGPPDDPTTGRLEKISSGQIERIGQPDTRLLPVGPNGEKHAPIPLEAPDHRTAAHYLIDWLEKQPAFPSIQAVGHRVVHGLEHIEPEIITPTLIEELRKIQLYDPDHLPQEIEGMEIFRERHPKQVQVACFDTAFHAGMPRVAKLLPVPRRYDAMGIRRFGFHGLSYAYIMEELTRVAGDQTARGRLILAHLGSGASLAAVRDGKSIDTSMGFTPCGGLVMGTRPGDLDPGVAWYILQSEQGGQGNPERFNALINHECGLLGISETSSDMRDLLTDQAQDIRAAEAVAFFCYQARKWVGAFAAALGGLDTLVFAGGIGENAAEVRSRICEGLEFLGVQLDAVKNAGHADVLSSDDSPVSVRIIRTDEEVMIAKTVFRLLLKKNIQPWN
jgi:acetate kinase